MSFEHLKQRLLFVVGKGGVGRSSVSSALAAYFSQKKENVLVVQWALGNFISPNDNLFSFNTINFNVDEAIKEYFVDHLKMKLLYNIIIQNKHVQKLIHAAPGISELFFLGKLFWLVELSQKERGVFYDRIIVDTPATGHGVSLFGISKVVSNLGISGPLAFECERIANLLADKEKTATLLVTLPEELPVEECIEFYPTLTEKLGYAPLYLIVNQSVRESIYPQIPAFLNEIWFKNMLQSLHSDTAKQELVSLVSSLIKRNTYEKKLEEFAKTKNLNIISVPDFNLISNTGSSFQIVKAMTEFFNTNKDDNE